MTRAQIRWSTATLFAAVTAASYFGCSSSSPKQTGGTGGDEPSGGTGGATPTGGKGGSTGGKGGGGTGGAQGGTGGGGTGGGMAGTGGGTAGTGGGAGGMVGKLSCTPSGEMPTLKKTVLMGQVPGAQEVSAPPDSPDEVWVLGHYSGDVRVYKGGMLLPTPIAHVDVRQDPPGKEQGLLSIAFDPAYATNKTFYLFYSAATPTGQTTIQAWKRTGDTAATAGDKIWDKAHPHQFHNGGAIRFKADGKLYFAIGNNNNPAESVKTEGLYGRILQIDVAAKTGKTYAYGLRNPYRMTIDPQTDDMYIGDVGNGGGMSEKFFWQAGDAAPGKNWGFAGDDDREGVEYIDQIGSNSGAGIGGEIYRGSKMPGLCGRYFYGHYPSGNVWSVKIVDGKPTDKKAHPELSAGQLSSFGKDATGELYMGTLAGTVIRIDEAK